MLYLTCSLLSSGKIPYYTMPPVRNAWEPSEANIVSELGQEFNVDEVYGNESSFIGSLKSVNDLQPVEVPSNNPVNFDETMFEVCNLLISFSLSKNSHLFQVVWWP